MAKELSAEAAAAAQEKAKLQEEKKQFKKEQKEQKKEAKRRAAEIARQEEALGEDGGNGFVTFAATLLIVVLWVAVICVIIKLDIGGFGSSVLAPILKDVPYVNKILPATTVVETDDPESYGGYTSLEEAVNYIRDLEQQLERLQIAYNTQNADVDALKAEVQRLQEFEKMQAQFQRIKTEFAEELVSTAGIEDFRKYYEEIDPTTAEYIYRQVVIQSEESAEVQQYALRYASMKPKQAASAFEAMDDLNLVAKILETMDVDSAAKIMDQMTSEVVAKLAKIMNPDP